MSEQEFTKAYNSILKHYLEEPIVEVSSLKFKMYRFILFDTNYNLYHAVLFKIAKLLLQSIIYKENIWDDSRDRVRDSLTTSQNLV